MLGISLINYIIYIIYTEMDGGFYLFRCEYFVFFCYSFELEFA